MEDKGRRKKYIDFKAIGKKINKIKLPINFDFGVIVLLIVVMVFFVRCFNIAITSTERGGHAYVEILNYTVPFIETQAYEESAYEENTMSLKTIVLEALGIGGIGNTDILCSEMPFLNEDLKIVKDIRDDKVVEKPFEVLDNSIAKVDKDDKKTYNPALKKEVKSSKPEVLLYHSHSSENFAESKNSTDNTKYNIVGVGEVIAKELEDNYGINVIHDKTIYDLSYNDAYINSRKGLYKYKGKYGDNFKLVIDIHRDGFRINNNLNKLRKISTTKIENESVAKTLFVVANNSENVGSSKKITNELIKISNRLYPTLHRGEEPRVVDGATAKYNQHVFKNSTLVEVGAQINTSEEARNTGEYLARIIAEYVNDYDKKNKK